ncbi:MAG: phage recombination protein Bet [Epsilonproteobacteria bacterium]|nr:phage recombination protein Bet [Campylobacterota bacterium]
MSNEQKQEIAVIYKIDDNEIKLTPKIVQDYIVGSSVQISMSEFKMFTELCKVRKLNPFLKEAYLIKFGTQPAQIVVGKDAILKRAVKHHQFDGREQGIIVINQDGAIEERKGTFKLKDEQIVGGWAKVYRKDWTYPTYITVSLDEVAQKKGDGTLNSNWASKSATMVEKVALVRAIRETFVEELAGMIDENEAWQNNEPRSSNQPITKQADVFDGEIQAEVIEDEQKKPRTQVSLDDVN